MNVALAHWGRNLLALALFGLLAELLLPSRATEGYVRLVIGLVLLTAVVSPVLGVVRGALGTGLGALSGSGGATSLSSLLHAEATTAPSGQAALVAQVFAREVAKVAQNAARSLPGVVSATAAAQVSGGPGSAYGQLEGVRLTVGVRAGAAAGPGRAAGVARAVADALGLGLAQVHVRLRSMPGPAP